MADKSYDVVVIGSGPGGYVCAIRSAQLGLKTACVEKDATLGGTCLNVGCIPSKALLHASEKYVEARNHLKDFGVTVGDVGLDLKTMMKHKDKTIDGNVKGVEFLFKKNKIDRLQGHGRLTGKNTVEITDGDGKKTTVEAKSIVLATGSESIPLPNVPVDEKKIVTSTGGLSLDAVPKSMVVVGGGYIGLEMGSVWSRLGAEVTVVEYLDKIVPGCDGEVGKTMQRTLQRQGMKFKLGTKVTGAEVLKDGVKLTLEPAKGGDPETVTVDVVLVAIGRKPYTEGLGLETAGVELDDRGRIKTDKHWKTSTDNIYAIGDVIEGKMLAHKAEDEGVAVAEILAGQSGHLDPDTIPGVVYTAPEVAQVGKTEEELKEAGVAYNVGKFPFTANGRARAMNATDGFVKVLADKTTDRILGIHIIGAEAGTMIAECVLAMEFGASAEDIARTCHAHPTLNEAVKEAALAVDGRALHT